MVIMETTRQTSQQDQDRRSLALHRLVAEKMRRDPALIGRAAVILARWRANAQPGTDRWLRQWATLFDQGLAATLAVATEDSEHARALRQSSPLSCLLSNKDRWEFLAHWKRNEEAHEAART